MSEKEMVLKKITTEFAKWEVMLSNLNSLNLYDANLFSEDTICNLLNCVFDYELKSLNAKIGNHPAIDLGDKRNAICVQVTSSNSSKKIQSTLSKFFENNLHSEYNELFLLILGKKQKRYHQFTIRNQFSFANDIHILDFRDLLRTIRVLPLAKLKKVNKILLEQNGPPNRRFKSVSSATKLKRKLSLRKRMQKDFLHTLNLEDWEYIRYEPYRKFVYHHVLIRSIDDTKWPMVDSDPGEGKMSSWYKGEFWDFYENGIELIWFGKDVIFDKKGNWDVVDREDDKRRNDEKYKVVPYSCFYRIPYEYIVEYDMDTDPYNGLPSIYVTYAKNDTPYEEIVFGQPGSYKNRKYTWYFDMGKQKKLP